MRKPGAQFKGVTHQGAPLGNVYNVRLGQTCVSVMRTLVYCTKQQISSVKSFIVLPPGRVLI